MSFCAWETPQITQKRSALPSTQRISTTDETSQRLKTRWRSSKNDVEAFAFCQGQECKMDMFAIFQNIVNKFCTQRTELLIKCVVRDNVVLIFHPFNHWPES